MKKGDKLKSLSEVGGGKVAGLHGKNIVLVEDEDGFEIPMPINEVVVVEQDDYAMGKMISAKMDAKQKAEEHANTELHQDSRSIKAIQRLSRIRAYRHQGRDQHSLRDLYGERQQLLSPLHLSRGRGQCLDIEGRGRDRA